MQAPQALFRSLVSTIPPEVLEETLCPLTRLPFQDAVRLNCENQCTFSREKIIEVTGRILPCEELIPFKCPLCHFEVTSCEFDLRIQRITNKIWHTHLISDEIFSALNSQRAAASAAKASEVIDKPWSPFPECLQVGILNDSDEQVEFSFFSPLDPCCIKTLSIKKNDLVLEIGLEKVHLNFVDFFLKLNIVLERAFNSKKHFYIRDVIMLKRFLNVFKKDIMTHEGLNVLSDIHILLMRRMNDEKNLILSIDSATFLMSSFPKGDLKIESREYSQFGDKKSIYTTNIFSKCPFKQVTLSFMPQELECYHASFQIRNPDQFRNMSSYLRTFITSLEGGFDQFIFKGNATQSSQFVRILEFLKYFDTAPQSSLYNKDLEEFKYKVIKMYMLEI